MGGEKLLDASLFAGVDLPIDRRGIGDDRAAGVLGDFDTPPVELRKSIEHAGRQFEEIHREASRRRRIVVNRSRTKTATCGGR